MCQHSKCLPDFPCNSASALQLEIGRKASDLAARASGGAAASTASLLQQLLPCACFWEWKGLQSVQVAFSLRWKAARSVPVFCSFFLHVSAASTLSVCWRSGRGFLAGEAAPSPAESILPAAVRSGAGACAERGRQQALTFGQLRIAV